MKNKSRQAGQKKHPWRQSILCLPIVLIVIFALGFLTPFLFMVGPVFGFAYILKERGIQNAPGTKGKILITLRGAIIGTFMTVSILVPFRAVVTGFIWLSGWKNLQESWEKMSSAGFADAWFGVCGLAFAVVFGMMVWARSLRVKSQIENLSTSTVRSAAMGLSEFKGIARPIEDAALRFAETIVDGKKEIKKNIRSSQGVPITKNVISEEKQGPILLEVFNRHSQISTIHYSRFFLEDETGKILVDPRGIDFWDGHGHFMWKPIRSIYLETRHSLDADKETRRLLPGDPVFIIGSIEENNEAGQDASSLERLILRPSNSLKSPSLFKSIMFGKDWKTSGTDIFDVFLLSDLSELQIKERITRGAFGIWKWVLAYVSFSAPLVLFFGHRLFDLNAANKFISILPGGKSIYSTLALIYYYLKNWLIL